MAMLKGVGITILFFIALAIVFMILVKFFEWLGKADDKDGENLRPIQRLWNKSKLCLGLLLGFVVVVFGIFCIIKECSHKASNNDIEWVNDGNRPDRF